MEDSASDTAGFLREVSRDVAKTVTLALIGTAGIFIGLSNEPSLHPPYGWPVILASVATIALLLSFGNILRLVTRRRARLKVGRASGTRISILLPRLSGDDRRGTKRETIREDIKEELGGAIELVLWPEPLTLSEGRDDEAERRSEDTARKWLRQTGCDVIIWGRVRGDRVLKLSVLGADNEYLELAIALHREAAAANDPSENFELWSQELAEMASLLLILAEAANRTEPLQRARACLGDLIKECGERYGTEAYPAERAMAETLLEQVDLAQQRAGSLAAPSTYHDAA